MILGLLLLLGALPASLAPGAPELHEAQNRLDALLAVERAVATATARTQAAWAARTALTPPKGQRLPGPCADPERVGLGWRIEHFGAAWREAAQAVTAQAERVRTVRRSPVAAPLVDAAWAAALDADLAAADRARVAFLEASAWEARHVRPVLAKCPAPPLLAAPGFALPGPGERGAAPAPVAVLALGAGQVCPGGERAEEGVVLLADGRGCWEAGPACVCAPEPVLPGAVLGPAPPPSATGAGSPATAEAASPPDAPPPEPGVSDPGPPRGRPGPAP